MAPQGWIELQLESAWTVKYEKSVVWNPTRWSKGCEREHWHPPVCSESYKEIHMDPLNILTLELTTNLSCSSIECETNTCPGSCCTNPPFACLCGTLSRTWHEASCTALRRTCCALPHRFSMAQHGRAATHTVSIAVIFYLKRCMHFREASPAW